MADRYSVQATASPEKCSYGEWVLYEDVERLLNCARMEGEDILEEAWNAINAKIKPGRLSGNGLDETAERNGLIHASNIIMEMRTKRSELND